MKTKPMPTIFSIIVLVIIIWMMQAILNYVFPITITFLQVAGMFVVVSFMRMWLSGLDISIKENQEALKKKYVSED